MAWYKNGTIAISGVTVTGTGTNWTDNKSGIGPGQALLVPAAGTVKMYEILRVDSATKITLTSSAGTVAAGSAYAVMSFYTDSVPDFARRLSAQLTYYQSQMDGWQQIMTSTGSVTLEAPDGTQITLSSVKKLTSDMAAKADLVNGVVALTQGGTGASDAAGARSKLGLGNAATATVTASSADPTFGRVMTVADFGLGATAATALGSPDANGIAFTSMLVGAGASGPVYNFFDGSAPIFTMVSGSRRVQQQISSGGALAVRGSTNAGVSWTGWFRQWGEANTTVDSNGFIKRASPVVKLFADGRAETNEESEGVIVTRLSEGVYSIEGCMGMNADATWGGTDGGFEIPVDRNKQPLLWLDYKVCADGSIKVKTFHRTYPEAPDFARNTREGYADGDPIDIPADQFVSVRVEMPQNSIWNQKQEADRIAMEEAERLAAEQAETSGTGSDKN